MGSVQKPFTKTRHHDNQTPFQDEVYGKCLEWTKACSGKVTSCLQCFSGPGHEDPECAEGRGEGRSCGAGFDGCYVAANENRSGGYWDRGCCTANKTKAETRCLEIHKDTGVGRTDQSW